jgi:cytochrome c peroxidase
MKRIILLVTSAVSLSILVTLIFSPGAAQGKDKNKHPKPEPSPTAYNPYPPGILPADLDSELMRVQREIQKIEDVTLVQAKALPPLTFTTNPPIIHGNGYQAVEALGKLFQYDLKMSPFENTACASCHMPYAAFSGPIPSVNLTMIAYPGSFHFRAGKRTAQRYTYSPDFPVLELNLTQSVPKMSAAFFGGNFWDGRATGYLLQSPDAHQAQGPPVDTLEMMFPDTACIAFRLQTAPYRFLFEEIFGEGSLDIKFPHEAEEICATPGGAAVFGTDVTPIKLKPEDRVMANNVFDHWGQALSFFERSTNLSAFTSKFDAFLAGKVSLSTDEMAGYDLFKGKANCNSCHLDGRSTAPTPPPPQGTAPNSTDTGAAASTRPLFTCFGYSNLGLPLNPRIALFYETTPDFFGFTPNPLIPAGSTTPNGFAYRDLGLGNFLRSGFGSWDNPNSDWVPFAPVTDGQFQTLTARDVALVPPKCTTEAPGPYFQKEFFHNGYAKSLKQLVHFYNTRDMFPFPVTSGHCGDVGKTEKVDCWPTPEVPNNIDMTVGNLMLTDTEENQIVAFLQTLTDGFTTPFPDINTFTGTCMTGGTAATQGNEFLIPTPPLPPCAASICQASPLPSPNPIP